MSTKLTDKLLLSNVDIVDYFKIDLIACVRKEQLSTMVRRKNGAYIINLQDQEFGNGSHWTAFYIYDSQFAYFDSYGTPPPQEVITFTQNITQRSINFDQIQNLNRDLFCGFYTLAFCHSCVINKERYSLDDILIDFCSPFDLHEPRKNAKLLQTMFKNMLQGKK